MKFYVLQPDGARFGTRWAYGEIMRPANFGEAPRCPKCNRPLGMRKWLAPRRLRLSSSRQTKWGDIVWGDGFSFVVSESFKRSYLHYELTGIEQFLPPVEIVQAGNKRPEVLARIPTYYPIVTELLAADINDAKSNVIRKPQLCQYCRGDIVSIDQVVVQESSWNGSDVFIARGLYGVVLVTERFKEMSTQETLTNIYLIPTLEFSYNYGSDEST